jgi:hypothetical protein
LPALVRTIIAPYVNEVQERITIGGPDLPVSGSAVMSVALLLHEIATNAAKYGAFVVTKRPRRRQLVGVERRTPAGLAGAVHCLTDSQNVRDLAAYLPG